MIPSEITNRTELLGALWSLSDSQFWNAAEFSNWVSDLLLETQTPATFLMDLVVVSHSNRLDSILQRALVDNQILLPDWADLLTAGLILLDWRNGVLTDHQTRFKLADLCDPGPLLGISIEQVEEASLCDPRLEQARLAASDIVKQLMARPFAALITNAASDA